MLENVMRLYNANFSPNALRVRAVAHELGVELSDEQVLGVLDGIKEVPKGVSIDDELLAQLAGRVTGTTAS